MFRIVPLLVPAEDRCEEYPEHTTAWVNAADPLVG